MPLPWGDWIQILGVDGDEAALFGVRAGQPTVIGVCSRGHQKWAVRVDSGSPIAVLRSGIIVVVDEEADDGGWNGWFKVIDRNGELVASDESSSTVVPAAACTGFGRTSYGSVVMLTFEPTGVWEYLDDTRRLQPSSLPAGVRSSSEITERLGTWLGLSSGNDRLPIMLHVVEPDRAWNVAVSVPGAPFFNSFSVGEAGSVAVSSANSIRIFRIVDQDEVNSGAVRLLG